MLSQASLDMENRERSAFPSEVRHLAGGPSNKIRAHSYTATFAISSGDSSSMQADAIRAGELSD